MPLTYGKAKEILAQYAGQGGKCVTDPSVDLFVRQVLEYMLVSGQYGNLRKFSFNAIQGCITLPYELEVPLKVKVDGVVGTVWDKWFEYHAGRWRDIPGCLPAETALYEEPDYYPTVYDLPSCGAQVACAATADEAKDAHIIVKGLDTTGREVFTDHQGVKMSGEYISIKKGELRYTQVVFGKITEIVKTPTIGYVPLYWINTASNLKGFLADYSPVEELPQYRRFKLNTPCGPSVKVSILGRIRLKPHYMDNDLIPFDQIYSLNLAGQAITKNYNDDVEGARAKDATLTDIISRENEYKRVQNGQPVEFYVPTSAGAIVNIINDQGGFYGFGGLPGRRRG